VGVTGGVAAGTADHNTHQFRHELASQDFDDRVVFPGDLLQGFIYVQVQPYRVIQIKVTNITERVTQEIELPVTVTAHSLRYPKPVNSDGAASARGWCEADNQGSNSS
jgi:hypothetical protein